jgi:HPt (histidine-containing phosphotransfer) domain-containing protein
VTKRLLDPQIVGQIRTLGGDKLLGDLIEMYLRYTPERLALFRRGVLGDDLAQAEKAIHSFRSSSVSLGALAEAEQAARLERLARQGDGAALRRRLEEFEAIVERLLSGLRALHEGEIG